MAVGGLPRANQVSVGTSQPRRLLRAYLAFVGLGIVVTLGVALLHVDWPILVGTLTALLGIYPVVRSACRERADWFEPIHWFVAYIVLTIVVRGFWELSAGSPIMRADAHDSELRFLLTWVFLYTSLFLVCLYAGYYSRLGVVLARALPRFQAPHLSLPRVAVAVLGSLLVALPAFWIAIEILGRHVAAGTFTAATREGGVTWIGFLLRFAWVGAVIAVAYTLWNGRAWLAGASLIYLAGVAFAIFLVFPKKIVVANTVLAALVLINYLRRRIGIRSVAVGLILGLASFPILSAYRYYGARPTQLLNATVSSLSKPRLVLDALVVRLHGADSFAAVIDDVRRTGQLEMGATFSELLWWYVPRASWPEKPRTYAIRFGQEYLRASGYFSHDVSGAPTVMGELYLNFYWPGLIIGGLLFGLILRVAYVYLISSHSPVGVVLYSIMLPGLIIFAEGPLASQMQDLLMSLIPALCLVLAMQVAGAPHARTDSLAPK